MNKQLSQEAKLIWLHNVYARCRIEIFKVHQDTLSYRWGYRWGITLVWPQVDRESRQLHETAYGKTVGEAVEGLFYMRTKGRWIEFKPSVP